MKDEKEKKDKKIVIRVSKVEKRQLKKNAENNDMNLSEYILLCGTRKMQKKNGNLDYDANMAIAVQEILNYIEEKYATDNELRKKVDELWKKL